MARHVGRLLADLPRRANHHVLDLGRVQGRVAREQGVDAVCDELVGAVRNIDDVGERVKAFLAQDDAAAKFGWEITADVLLYSASLLGEIADDVSNIDRAMRWGFAWDQGPFQTWDAIGVAESVERMKADGREIPAVVDKAVAAGGWYSREGGTSQYLDVLGSGEYVPESEPEGRIVLLDLKEHRL